MNYDKRLTLDAFKPQTTYQNDYLRFPLQRNAKSEAYKQDSEAPTKPPPERILYDHETFQAWRKGVHIPFNLLWRPKHFPRDPPEPSIHESQAREEAQKTRPRVYMSPAVSMDDVEDPEMRQLLCQHMYTTDWNKAVQESSEGIPKKEMVNPKMAPTIGDPATLTLDFIPPLPDGFRNRGLSWEDDQERACVDPTETFWVHKDPPVQCGACADPYKGLIPEEKKQQIRELIAKDNLRLPHDIPIPGYAGYRPRLSYGVSLPKVDIPIAHPFLSVTQAITKRYANKKL